MLRTATKLAALVLIGGLAAGCGDDDPKKPDAQPSSSTSTSTPTDPTSEPVDVPTKPALPDAATKATKEGAEAFILYYWQALDYAQATGDVKPLRRIVSAKCDTCVAIAKGIREHYRDGGTLTNDTPRVELTATTKVTGGGPELYSFKIDQTVQYEEQTITYGNGKVEVAEADERSWVAYVLWIGSNWRVDIQDVLAR